MEARCSANSFGNRRPAACLRQQGPRAHEGRTCLAGRTRVLVRGNLAISYEYGGPVVPGACTGPSRAPIPKSIEHRFRGGRAPARGQVDSSLGPCKSAPRLVGASFQEPRWGRRSGRGGSRGQRCSTLLERVLELAGIRIPGPAPVLKARAAAAHLEPVAAQRWPRCPVCGGTSRRRAAALVANGEDAGGLRGRTAR